MTAQFLDAVMYQSETYGLLGISGSDLFDPKQHGLEAKAWSTATYRGFHCDYQVIDKALYLTRIHLGLDSEVVEGMKHGEHPTIFGKIPHRYTVHENIANFQTRKMEARVRESSEYLVDDLLEPIPFNGGMLIARQIDESFYPPLNISLEYGYDVLHELVFDSGHLIEGYDRSKEVAEFREMVFAQPLSALNRRQKVTEWALQHLKLKYRNFDYPTY